MDPLASLVSSRRSQDLTDNTQPAMQRIERRAFQAEETACTKDLRKRNGWKYSSQNLCRMSAWREDRVEEQMLWCCLESTDWLCNIGRPHKVYRFGKKGNLKGLCRRENAWLIVLRNTFVLEQEKELRWYGKGRGRSKNYKTVFPNHISVRELVMCIIWKFF